uniref:Ig-like domain-containing protein n=1 Tax=Knipowitschia caucasica TaxID=637954 RepID=A0AAV2MQG3_KNICA
MRALAVLLLSVCATVVSGDDSTDNVLTAAPGALAVLPCYGEGNVTAAVTSWMKNGKKIITEGTSTLLDNSRVPSSGSKSRVAVLRNGSLSIGVVEREDDGLYLCASTLPGNITFHAKVLLRVASGPDNVSIAITPAGVLPNGTFTTFRGESVYIICAGVSYPAQELTLSFNGLTNSTTSLVNHTGNEVLEYRMDNIQPSAQGIYSCMAHNEVSDQKGNKSAEVLVYYASDRHPECMWTQESTFVVFHCSWSDVNPAPNLTWTELPSGRILSSNVTDELPLIINGSLLFDGQTLRCGAQHPALHKGEEKTCTFTLKTPYTMGNPLATAVEGGSITLECSESRSTPPALTTWRRGVRQELIVNGSKYRVSAEGPRFTLTIVNISKDDEGVYFCLSQNPLGAKELQIYLTVKSSSEVTGAVIGLFISALIVGCAVIIAKTVYSSRHRICLGGFGRMEEDEGDVLSLVESDDEQIFPAAVPRLPPVSNGCQTTLVEIHGIPSTNHEEAETVDASTAAQDDAGRTEEPEDLMF